MSAYQRTHHIAALPSFLEYLSYVFCFGNLLAGPVIEYKDYQDFINLRGLWDPKAVRRVPVWGAFKQVGTAWPAGDDRHGLLSMQCNAGEGMDAL
jgi:hypothetical protein